MTAQAIDHGERRTWTIAASAALAAHVAVAALVLAWTRQPQPDLPDPVVLIELPALAAPAPASEPERPVDPQQTAIAQPLPRTPPIDVPPVRAPLPAVPVTLPPSPPPQPERQATASAPVAQQPAAPSVPTATAPATAIGSDPRAKKQEADYFALVSAHLNRRKTYPVEARQARQQGIVVVRFTVDRAGNVSGVSIKRGSGHATLDTATLALVQRVAPLPRMPASMQRDSVTLSLPIDYSLRTD